MLIPCFFLQFGYPLGGNGPGGVSQRHKPSLIESATGFGPVKKWGEKFPKYIQRQQVDDVRRAYDPRPEQDRRTGGNASGLHTRGGFSSTNRTGKHLFSWGVGGPVSFPLLPFPYPRHRRDIRRAPFTVFHMVGARHAPNTGARYCPRKPARTGGRGRGRDFPDIFTPCGAGEQNGPRLSCP